MDFKKILPIFGIIVLIYLFYTYDINGIISIIKGINPLYAFLSFFVAVPILVFVSVQWMLVLRKQKIIVSWKYTFKNILIGYFYGLITPGGIGAYTRAIYLHDESGAPLPKCFANILIFNTMDFITILILGVIASLALISLVPYYFFAILIVLIFIIAAFSFILKKEKSKGLFNKFLGLRFLKSFKDRFDSPIEEFYQDIPSFKDLSLPFVISIVGWLVRFSEFYLISLIFDIHVPFFYFIMIVTLGNIVTMIPISFYGLGTRDLFLISMFAIFNIGAERVLVMTLYWFTIALLIPSIIGAIISVFEGKTKPKLSEG